MKRIVLSTLAIILMLACRGLTPVPTQTPVQPSPTATELPGPTWSDKFDLIIPNDTGSLSTSVWWFDNYMEDPDVGYDWNDIFSQNFEDPDGNINTLTIKHFGEVDPARTAGFIVVQNMKIAGQEVLWIYMWQTAEDYSLKHVQYTVTIDGRSISEGAQTYDPVESPENLEPTIAGDCGIKHWIRFAKTGKYSVFAFICSPLQLPLPLISG